jgi:hypothetical protein
MGKNCFFQNRRRAAMINRRFIEPARKFAEFPRIFSAPDTSRLFAPKVRSAKLSAVDVKH